MTRGPAAQPRRESSAGRSVRPRGQPRRCQAAPHGQGRARTAGGRSGPYGCAPRARPGTG
eukprot:13607939-Alexandrium_andersonii.AAC.1